MTTKTIVYERLNRRLQEKAEDSTTRAVTYVALGDSVTQGVMQQGVYEYELLYHQVCKRSLQQRYPGTVLNVINSGVNGDLACRAVGRWDRDVQPYSPDLITIMFGHNDVHEGAAGLSAYLEAIDELILRARTDTEADILLLSPCMMMTRDNPRIALEHRPLVPDFIRLAEEGILLNYVTALRQYAEQQRIPLLDVYAIGEAMEQRGEDMHVRLANGLNHPDQLFHIELGNHLYNQLTSGLSDGALPLP